MSEEQASEQINETEDSGGGPPPYDPRSVGRVAGRVQILTVELLGAHFSRVDDGPLLAAPVYDAAPEIGIHIEWAANEDRTLLSCAIAFATQFGGELDEEPWQLLARFRLDYTVSGGADLTDHELDNFEHWNAMFNAWPYWREYLSSTVNRAQLPRFVLPVIGVPREGAGTDITTSSDA
jgi:hypothetical protein